MGERNLLRAPIAQLRRREELVGNSPIAGLRILAGGSILRYRGQGNRTEGLRIVDPASRCHC